MNVRRSWTRGCAIATAVLVAVAVTIPAGAARADVAFRKKKAPATDTPAPSGGETEGEVTPTAQGDADNPPPTPKTEYVPQAEDKDRPKEPVLIDKPAADAALAKKAKKDEGPAWYTNWKYWALIGGGIIVAGGAIYGLSRLAHSINGGDVRGCNPDFMTNCFGAGR